MTADIHTVSSLSSNFKHVGCWSMAADPAWSVLSLCWQMNRVHLSTYLGRIDREIMETAHLSIWDELLCLIRASFRSYLPNCRQHIDHGLQNFKLLGFYGNSLKVYTRLELLKSTEQTSQASGTLKYIHAVEPEWMVIWTKDWIADTM